MKFFKTSALLLLIFFTLWSSVKAGESKVITTKSNLTLTGRVHAQFHTTSVDDYTPTSTFFVRRARLKATYSTFRRATRATTIRKQSF